MAADVLKACVYIDGLALGDALSSVGWGEHMWSCPIGLGQAFVSGNKRPLHLAKVAYATMKPSESREPGPSFKSYHAVLGDLQTGDSRRFLFRAVPRDKNVVPCRGCGNRDTKVLRKYRQRAYLISWVLADALTGFFDVAYVLIGDSSYYPLVEAINQYCRNKRLYLVFPPGSKVDELEKGFPRTKDYDSNIRSFGLEEQHFKGCRLPENYILQTGKSMGCPKQWKLGALEYARRYFQGSNFHCRQAGCDVKHGV